MIWLLLPIAFLLGAIGRRAAGGGLNQVFRPNGPRITGNTPTRLLFAAAVAFSAYLGGAVWWQALILVPLVWVGTTTGNQGLRTLGTGLAPVARFVTPLGSAARWLLSRDEGIGLGRDGKSYLWSVVALTIHGLMSAALPAIAAAYAGYHAWPFVVSGMLIAPLYEVGYRVARPVFPRGFQGGAELGECFWGGTCSVAALLTGVLG